MMKNKSRVFLRIQALVCVLLALLFSATAVSICREGAARKALNPLESIYTPEIIAEETAIIMPFLFAALGFTAAGLILGVKDERADKPVKDAMLARDLTVRRVRRPSEEMRREQAVQRRLQRIGWVAFALCMVPIAWFFAHPANFPATDPEIMFRGLIRVLLAWTAFGLGVLCVTAVLRERSVRRETEAAQIRLKEETAEGLSAAPSPAAQAKNPHIIQAVLLAAAVILIIAGIFNGSARDVLYKAITICSECVGLG